MLKRISRSLDKLFQGVPNFIFMSDHNNLVAFFLEILFTLIVVTVEHCVIGLVAVCRLFSDQNDDQLVVLIDGNIS